MLRPIPNSYWVEPGRLLAGEYPGSRDEAIGRAKLRRLLAAGVNTFIDLTEAHELPPYEPLAAELGQPIEHLRLAIHDFDTPSREHMQRVQAAIEQAVGAQRVVYVHCWGGIGRTGTVIGCYLVAHGLTGPEALARIAAWRVGTPAADRVSPETDAQRKFVLEWAHRP